MAKQTEVIHNGRIKMMSETKLNRLFAHHADWHKEVVRQFGYTVVRFKKQDRVKVFQIKLQR